MRTDRLLHRGAAVEAVLEMALLLALFVFVAASPSAQNAAPEPTTPPILDTEGKPVRSAIGSLEPAMVNGSKQWLLIRGYDIWNPVLLYLDSAPGASHMAWSRRYNAELEKHFIVVNWDQRGAGKSFTGKPLSGQGSVDTLVEDVVDVTSQLRARFRQDKVYVLGHGYGALIGALAAQRHPELFHAFIAVAPVVSPAGAEQTAYRGAVDAATQRADAATLEQLKALGPPPYTGKDAYAKHAGLRTAAIQAAGGAYPANSFRDTMTAAIADAPEYNAAERQRLPQAQAETFAAVHPALARVDLGKEVPTLAVPVYFVLGRHDHAGAPAAAETYFEMLKAPLKALAWFEQSGQAPNYEEPDKFLQMMTSKVLTDTRGRRDVTQ